MPRISPAGTKERYAVTTMLILLPLAIGAGCGNDALSGTPTLLVSFDPAAAELPEGLATAGDRAYVGMFNLGRVVTVDDAGTVAPFGELPAGPEGTTFVVGLAAAPSGELYVAFGSFTPAAPSGIYRIPAGGGAAELFATDPGFQVLNDLAFAEDGTLFATDSSGAIFTVTPDGVVSRWSDDPLLGPGGPCGPIGGDVPLGANGLSVEEDAVVVSNTEQAILLRIPRLAGGAAGPGAIVAGPDCESLFGVDGIVADGEGGWLAAVQRGHRVMRVGGDGSIETFAAGGVLDSPASVDIATHGKRRLLVTSSAFESAQIPGASPRPGVVEIDL